MSMAIARNMSSVVSMVNNRAWQQKQIETISQTARLDAMRMHWAIQPNFEVAEDGMDENNISEYDQLLEKFGESIMALGDAVKQSLRDGETVPLFILDRVVHLFTSEDAKEFAGINMGWMSTNRISELQRFIDAIDLLDHYENILNSIPPGDARLGDFERRVLEEQIASLSYIISAESVHKKLQAPLVFPEVWEKRMCEPHERYGNIFEDLHSLDFFGLQDYGQLTTNAERREALVSALKTTVDRQNQTGILIDTQATKRTFEELEQQRLYTIAHQARIHFEWSIKPHVLTLDDVGSTLKSGSTALSEILGYGANAAKVAPPGLMPGLIVNTRA